MASNSDYMAKRDLHRHYITTPKWKAFRLQALAHYGAICNRCGGHGCDVHHKTYKNWGNENLEDVEILCRPCHEAEEAMKRAARVKGSASTKPKRMHLKAIWAYMTGSQRRIIMEKFKIETEAKLNLEIVHAAGMSKVLEFACGMMKVKPYGFPVSKNGKKEKSVKVCKKNQPIATGYTPSGAPATVIDPDKLTRRHQRKIENRKALASLNLSPWQP
jgi:hypothetical protein